VVALLRGRGAEVVMDEFTAGLLPEAGIAPASGDLPSDCHLAITVGGDGTMLRAARLLSDHDIPLLGINCGRLGFLADIPANSLETELPGILDGNYVEDVRF